MYPIVQQGSETKALQGVDTSGKEVLEGYKPITKTGSLLQLVQCHDYYSLLPKVVLLTWI